MSLRQRLKETPGLAAAVARELGVPAAWLSQMASGKRAVPPRLVPLMERRLDIPRWELRPEDWHLIWPELIGADGAPPIPAPQLEMRDAA